MNKQKLLKIINPLLFLLIILQAVNIILLKTDPPSFAYMIHEWNGYVIMALVVIHVYLNWSWIKTNILTFRK